MVDSPYTIRAFDCFDNDRDLRRTYQLIQEEVAPINQRALKLALSESHVLGAFNPQNDLVGVAVVELEWRPSDVPESTAWLSYIAVARPLQRKQLYIGSRLLTCSEHLVIQVSSKKALGAGAGSDSAGFYTAHDYTQQNTRHWFKNLRGDEQAQLAAACPVRHTL